MRRLLLILFALLIPWQVFATTTLYVDTDAVSPTHPTYNHLADAITYLQGYNGGVLDDDFVIECSGSVADVTATEINSLTTSATNTLTIQGDGFASGSYVFNAEIKIEVSYTKLQLLNFGDSSKVIFWYYSSAHDIYMDRCFSSGRLLASSPSSGADATVYNCLFKKNNGSNYDDVVSATSADGTLYLYNNTVDINSLGNGIYLSSAGNCYAENNIIVNPGSSRICISGTLAAGSNNNITSDSTGTSGLQNIDPYSIFTDLDAKDYTLKVGSVAIGAGTDLSASFTTDITGATRSAPWDIGAFAYAAAATGWAGKIYGITPAKIMGVPVSNISKVGGL